MKKIYILIFVLICNSGYTQSSKSLEDTKSYIVKSIDEYAWEKDSKTKRLKATFEGDLLRVAVVNNKNSEIVNNGWLYNFATIYKFKSPKKAPGDIAYLDIWVDYLYDKKSEQWEKRKLVMEIRNQQAADELYIALKHLNELLIAKKPPVEKF